MLPSRYANLLQELPRTIRANFRQRNAPAFDNPRRQTHLKAVRRLALREYCSALRILRNPEALPYVRARLIDTGPLMGCDLRNRILLAGIEYNLAKIHRPKDPCLTGASGQSI